MLTLNTAGYSSITLNYLLYAILSQDGNADAAGGGNGDSFVVKVGSNVVSNYTFANYPGNSQSYCGQGSALTSCGPQTGAVAKDTLGYGSPGNGYDDATYSFSYTFAPTGATTQISFTSNDNEGVGNEFYAIDNVTVTGAPTAGPVSAAPEPGAWALMLGGVAMLGAMLRIRKARREEDAVSHTATA